MSPVNGCSGSAGRRVDLERPLFCSCDRAGAGVDHLLEELVGEYFDQRVADLGVPEPDVEVILESAGLDLLDAGDVVRDGVEIADVVLGDRFTTAHAEHAELLQAGRRHVQRSAVTPRCPYLNLVVLLSHEDFLP